MRITDIMDRYDFTLEVTEEALLASGFPVDEELDYKKEEVYLAKLYGKYLTLLELASVESNSFKYTDGEEAVDKTLVPDNYRRTATLWYDRWAEEMKRREEEAERDLYSKFVVRKRVW